MDKLPKAYWILFAGVLVSLGFNTWFFFKLSNAQKGISEGARDIIALLDQAQNQSISYTAHINQNVPVSATFDVNENIDVPIKTFVAINTTVNVPVSIPVIGQVTIPVPINTSVPVQTTVSVPIKKTIRIQGTSPVEVDIPIEIPIANTPFAEILSKLKEWISKNAGI